MADFEDKTEYEINDIQSLIENEIEESIHLDFKEANALDKSDGKKKDISKDVSAFANSDGGIIIYGVREVNHKASAITYIDGNIFTKEWLEQTINSSIQRRISDIKIYPIRNEGNIQQTIYLVKIPKSYDTPHICKDKRFYKRFNFESVMMEEYEIRQLYGQKIKSKLILWNWKIGPKDDDDTEKNNLTLFFEVSVLNDGDIAESNFKVNVYFKKFNVNLIQLSLEKNNLHFDHTWLDDNRLKISSNNSVPIYPNEAVNAIRFNLSVARTKIKEALEELEFEIILFYNNGEDKMQGDFKEVVKKNTNQLE